jgi:hypothetical protein
MELSDFITKYWQIGVAVIGVVITFVTLKNQNTFQAGQIKDLQDAVKVINTEVSSMNPVWSDIQARLASIETTLQFLTKGMK